MGSEMCIRDRTNPEVTCPRLGGALHRSRRPQPIEEACRLLLRRSLAGTPLPVRARSDAAGIQQPRAHPRVPIPLIFRAILTFTTPSIRGLDEQGAACDAGTPGVAPAPRRADSRVTTCPCCVTTRTTLRGSRSRRCVPPSRPIASIRPSATPPRAQEPARARPLADLPQPASTASSQVVVLMMSVCFIAFVTMLHAVSKIYQYRSS